MVNNTLSLASWEYFHFKPVVKGKVLSASKVWFSSLLYGTRQFVFSLFKTNLTWQLTKVPFLFSCALKFDCTSNC